MVWRVFSEKKREYAVEAQGLLSDIHNVLGLAGVERVRIVNRYDIEGIMTREQFEASVPVVFAEPPLDDVYFEDDFGGTNVFAVEPLPGQFDQRAASAAQCVQLLIKCELPTVKSAKVYIIEGSITTEELAAIKKYVINPVESREAARAKPMTLSDTIAKPAKVRVIDGFNQMNDDALAGLMRHENLALCLDDLRVVQKYFLGERRDPTKTELAVLDAYWSDHCRHTTFGTELENVMIHHERARRTWERFIATRTKTTKPTLMEVATFGLKVLCAKGVHPKVDESDEINACTVPVTIDVDGKDEDWLLLFKNETHNHPTEIEPFGGAATCIGGAIRDPLSGRAYVYHAMRITGSGDPRARFEDTLQGKLPQRKLTQTAAAGFSSYGNQIGLATGYVREYYHEGYIAKRLELGAVVGAAPASNVRRETPEAGDVVLLIGGGTGRDGIGGASGSSKAHEEVSADICGAQVQKGNAPTERKLQRLFRNPDFTRRVKRCNDFGAGGVCVAIGELADGLTIELDNVPKKYEGLDGTELAISESQERMAVVVSACDCEYVASLARSENLDAARVAVVTAEPRLTMRWQGDTIVNMSREFLNANGAKRGADVVVSECACVEARDDSGDIQGDAIQGDIIQSDILDRIRATLSDLNVCSQQGLSERFDSTIGAGSVLMPFGGFRQRTPIQTMVARFPVDGVTNACSGMSCGFNLPLLTLDPYMGAFASVCESVAKLVAAGFNRRGAYLTLQEYFPRMTDDPKRWGMPLSALLGALEAQYALEVAAIGGKDSMSGSFENLDVPPTLVSFAVAAGDARNVVSPEFKEAGYSVYLIDADPNRDASEYVRSLDWLEGAIARREVVSAWVVEQGGIIEGLVKCALGNLIGVNVDCDAITLFENKQGAIIIETSASIDDSIPCVLIGETTVNPALVIGGIAYGLDEIERIYDEPLEGVFPRMAGEKGNNKNKLNTENILSQNNVLNVDYNNSPDKINYINANIFQEKTENTDNILLQDNVLNVDNNIITDDIFNVINDTKENTPNVNYNISQENIINNNNELFPNNNFSVNNKLSPNKNISFVSSLGISKPLAFIPVFPGTNCEIDTANALKRAGGDATVFVVNNMTENDIKRSSDEAANLIAKSQMIIIPGGFSGGDEPEGSAKLIAAFMRSQAVSLALESLMNERNGLILGICNGFQALVKLGLVPYGRIIDANEASPTLTYNSIGRHQSMLVRTRVASTLSPWLSKCEVGDIHTVAISHGEGRFVASGAIVRELAEHGQIAAQYVDEDGEPTLCMPYNPNGSVYAIEAITSADGRILGKMGHSERANSHLYKNIRGCAYQPLFESGVGYFR